jgi:dTMP kinase
VKGLVENLTDQGFNSLYVYARYRPILLRPLITLSGLSLLRNEDFFTDYQRYSQSKKQYSQNHRFLAKLYRTALLFDYSLQILIKVGIPMVRGRTVVCDRYIYDTIATDLAVDFNLSEDEIISYVKNLPGIFPKPDLAFFVDLPEEEAIRRKSDVPSIQYLSDRRGIFHTISDTAGMVVLDGLKSPGVLVEEAENIVRGEVLRQGLP